MAKPPVRSPGPLAPEKLQVDDVVESCYRQKYLPWIVRECWPNEDGTQTVIVSHPGRGAARFTWYGANPDNRYGIGSAQRNPPKYYFSERPSPVVVESELPEPMPGDVWRYKDRADYEVLFVANTAHASEKHPPDVVYRRVERPSEFWTRPLKDWHRAFKLQRRGSKT